MRTGLPPEEAGHDSGIAEVFDRDPGLDGVQRLVPGEVGDEGGPDELGLGDAEARGFFIDGAFEVVVHACSDAGRHDGRTLGAVWRREVSVCLLTAHGTRSGERGVSAVAPGEDRVYVGSRAGSSTRARTEAALLVTDRKGSTLWAM